MKKRTTINIGDDNIINYAFNYHSNKKEGQEKEDFNLFKEEVRKLISTGYTNKALEYILAHNLCKDNGALQNEMTILSNRYTELQKKINQNTLSDEEENIVLNKINLAILNTLDNHCK